MRELLLGIDIGTSACKVAVFDKDGHVAASVTEDYPVYYPHTGWAEQNPDDWWEGVSKAIRRLMDSPDVSPEEIVGVGVDGQSWSAVAVDKEGKVLCPTPIWMDTRSNDICQEMTAKIGAERIFAVDGNPLQPMYTTPKVLWYERTMPELYGRIDKILQCNGFIVYRLTGAVTQDLSQGYGWHCFDMRRGCWNLEMAGELGIPERFLPEITACDAVVGHVTAQAAAQCGLLEGTPVVAGGLDACCGTLGVGVSEPGETQEQGGQAGGMSICMDQYHADPRLILGYHVVPGRSALKSCVGAIGSAKSTSTVPSASARTVIEQGVPSAVLPSSSAVRVPDASIPLHDLLASETVPASTLRYLALARPVRGRVSVKTPARRFVVVSKTGTSANVFSAGSESDSILFITAASSALVMLLPGLNVPSVYPVTYPWAAQNSTPAVYHLPDGTSENVAANTAVHNTATIRIVHSIFFILTSPFKTSIYVCFYYNITCNYGDLEKREWMLNLFIL